jgi:hypothetical protein
MNLPWELWLFWSFFFHHNRKRRAFDLNIRFESLFRRTRLKLSRLGYMTSSTEFPTTDSPNFSFFIHHNPIVPSFSFHSLHKPPSMSITTSPTHQKSTKFHLKILLAFDFHEGYVLFHSYCSQSSRWISADDYQFEGFWLIKLLLLVCWCRWINCWLLSVFSNVFNA